jgi:HEAT repeat protein
MRLRRTSLALCTLLVLGLATAQSADQLFTQGVNAYKAGDTAGAVSAFKAALATNPGHEEAFRMLDRVEQRVLMDMLTERGELGGLTDRLLAIAELGRREVIEDPGAAQEVVDRLLSGDEQQRQEAMLELRSRYGQWAVPALVGPLGNSASLDHRVSAIQALVRMGTPAVPPLMATLDSADPLTRRNAAAVLGTIGDRRAAASLAWIAQTDADEGAREAGREALSKMGVMAADAASMSVSQAQRYLRGDDEMVRPYDATTVVWHWEGGLVAERVLGGLQPLMLAESDLIRAMEHGGGNQVRATLAAIHAGQRAEIVAALSLPALQGHELTAAAQAMLPDLDLNLALAGRARGQALMICLTATPRRPLAAAQLMAHMGGSVEERQSVGAALGDPDALVSQGAALALARLGDMDAQVAQRLGDALSGVAGGHAASQDLPAQGRHRRAGGPAGRDPRRAGVRVHQRSAHGRHADRRGDLRRRRRRGAVQRSGGQGRLLGQHGRRGGGGR